MQTAVEWLVDRIAEKSVMEKDRYYIQYKSVTIDITHIIEQAKEMEKQQIIDAHIEGQRVFDKYPHTQWTNDQAEQYYNETYGTNN